MMLKMNLASLSFLCLSSAVAVSASFSWGAAIFLRGAGRFASRAAARHPHLLISQQPHSTAKSPLDCTAVSSMIYGNIGASLGQGCFGRVNQLQLSPPQAVDFLNAVEAAKEDRTADVHRCPFLESVPSVQEEIPQLVVKTLYNKPKFARADLRGTGVVQRRQQGSCSTWSTSCAHDNPCPRARKARALRAVTAKIYWCSAPAEEEDPTAANGGTIVMEEIQGKTLEDVLEDWKKDSSDHPRSSEEDKTPMQTSSSSRRQRAVESLNIVAAAISAFDAFQVDSRLIHGDLFLKNLMLVNDKAGERRVVFIDHSFTAEQDQISETFAPYQGAEGAAAIVQTDYIAGLVVLLEILEAGLCRTSIKDNRTKFTGKGGPQKFLEAIAPILESLESETADNERVQLVVGWLK